MVFMTALFGVMRSWRQSGCPSLVPWVLEMGWVHIVEYYGFCGSGILWARAA